MLAQLITDVDDGSATDGGDRITAVNLTRTIEPDELPPQMARLAEKLAQEVELPSEQEDEDAVAAEADLNAAAAAVALTTEHYIGGPCLAFRPTGLALLREPSHSSVSTALECSDQIKLGPQPGQQPQAGGSLLGGGSHTDGDDRGSDRADDDWEDGGRWVAGDLSTVCALVRHEAARRGGTNASVRVVWGDARWSRAQLYALILWNHGLHATRT